MFAAKCRVRVRLSRALFRRVAARAIENRTDLETIIVRAVQAENPGRRRRVHGKARR